MNLNEIVEVKLTFHGARIWNEYVKGIPHQKNHTGGDMLRTALWELFNIYGPHIYMGMGQGPFADNEIRKVLGNEDN